MQELIPLKISAGGSRGSESVNLYVIQESGFLCQAITCPPEFASTPYPPIIAHFSPHCSSNPNHKIEKQKIVNF
jgi:hypothetical protein